MIPALVAAVAVAPGTFHGCPRGVLPIPTPYLAAVDRAVLRFVRVKHAGDGVGAYGVDTRLVRRWLPSGWIKDECGRVVWERSVAVTIFFPKLDLGHNPVGRCNACAHLTYIAARTERGWTVWGNY